MISIGKRLKKLRIAGLVFGLFIIGVFLPFVQDVLASESVLFFEDFTADDIGEPAFGWSVDDETYVRSKVVEEVGPASGRALQVEAGPAFTSGLYGVQSQPWYYVSNDVKRITIDFKMRHVSGSHLAYVNSGTILMHWKIGANKTFEYDNNPVGRLEEGWNRIRIVADRETNEAYVYLNDLEGEGFGPFPLRNQPNTWRGAILRFTHNIGQDRTGESYYADIRVWTNDPVDDVWDPDHPGITRLRPTRGEVVPRMLSPNLIRNGDFDCCVRGWALVNESDVDASMHIVSTEHGPVLKLEKTTDGVVRLVSDRIAVTPNDVYQVTALYHTHNAKFGNMAEFSVVEISDPSQPETADLPVWRPSISATIGHRTVFNSPPGEWRRKTRRFNLSSNTQYVRLVLTVEGPPLTLLLDNVYFSLPNEIPRYSPSPEPELPAHRSDLIEVLTEAKEKLDNRIDSTAFIQRENELPRLVVDGRPMVPQIHFGDVSNPARAYFREFGEHNVNIHIVALRNVTRKLWTGYKTYDLDKVDEILWDAILRDPEGYFIVNLNLTPYPTWHEEFPDHVAQDRDGNWATSRHDRFAPPDYWSVEYREQAYDLVRTFVDHIHKQPYGKAVIGYFITGGEDGQFYWQVGRETIQDGNAPGSLPLFRQWIKERYPSLEELRRAWNDPTLTYENILPPIKNEKYPGAFMDPINNRKEVDFLMYLNEELAKLLLESARIAKEAAGKDVVVGAYYGRGASMSVYPMFAQTKVMLKSDFIDFMGAQPGYYGWRDVGSEGHINWVYDSVRSHGKIMMTELDFRTWKGTFRDLADDFHLTRFWNIEDLKGAAARDIGKLFSFLGGAWWYEMTGGWFRDDDIMAVIGQLSDVSQQLYESTPIITPADIVFIADEESYFWTTEQYNIRQARHTHSLNVQQRAISRAGIKYDFYYIDDIIEQEMDQYKVYVFLNLYYLGDEKRQFIENRLKRDGKILVWQYAPGYVTPEEFSLDSIELLTGIRVDTDHGGLSSKFVDEDTSETELLLAGLHGKVMGLGLAPVTQRFYVTDSSADPLARYDDGKVAAAVKYNGSYTSIYVGHPSGFTPRFIANIARLADVHTYLDPGEMFMYNRDDFIVIHGIEGGERVLRLPFEARIIDLLNQRVMAENTDELHFVINPNETLWLKIEK